MSNANRDELDKLRSDLRELRQRLEAAEWRLRELGEAEEPPPAPVTPPELPAAAPAESVADGLSRPPEPPGGSAIVAAGPPPIPEGDAPVAAAPKAKAAGSIEEKLGTRWLGRVGVLALLLAAVFFFQYAAQQGWVSYSVRVAVVTVAGLALIGMGEWTFRKNMRALSAAVTGGGLAMLYAAAFVASPNVYAIVSTPVAFGWMCVVTLMGVGLSLRSEMISSAILTQIGAYVTPLLLDTGQNQQMGLMVYLIIVTAGFLAVAILSRWQALAPLALAGTITLFATWGVQHYEEGAFASTMSFGWILAGAFIAYAYAATRFQRAWDAMGSAVLAVAGMAMAMLVLMIAPTDMVRFAHVFVLTLAALSVCRLREWLWPHQVVQFWVLLCFARALGGALDSWTYAAWAWVFVAVLCAASMGGWRRQVSRGVDSFNAMMVTQLGAAMGAWLVFALPQTAGWTLAHLFALGVVVLAAAWLRRWFVPRIAALVWSAVGVAFALTVIEGQDGVLAEVNPVGGCVWVWAFFGLFAADVWVRLRRSTRQMERRLDMGLALAAGALMYAATWRLLDSVWPGAGVAAYTAALAAAAIIAAVYLRRRTDRQWLGYAYLGQGLVLASLVAPQALDNMSVTVAWAAQAAVSMFLAVRLKEKMLLVKAPVLLIAATCHYFAVDIELAGAGGALFSVMGVEVTALLATAWALTAGVVASLVIQTAKGPFREGEYLPLATMLAVGAGVFWATQTAWLLPAVTATWWWLAMVAILAVVARWRAEPNVRAVAVGAALLCVGKFLVYDTLAVRLDQGVDTSRWVVANFQALLGVFLAVAALVAGRIAEQRGPILRPWGVALVLLAAILVVWTGSFEIDRAFADTEVDSGQARQMAYSVWWAICAIALLVAGLIGKHAPSRYLALGLFALTLAKVLIVDMVNVETVWRILSFVAVGSLLVGSSLAYHRYFGRGPIAEPTEEG